MKILKRFAVLIIVLFSCQGQTKHFVVTSDIWKPFFVESNGEYFGLGVDILKEVFSRTGDTFTIKHVPLRRAEALLEDGQADMMILDSPLWSDPEKSYQFIFTQTIIQVHEYIYYLRQAPVDFSNKAAMNKKVVSIRSGYRYPLFEDFFADGTLIKHEVGRDITLIRLLLSGRTNAIFMDAITFAYLCQLYKIDNSGIQQGLQLSEADVAMKLTIRDKEAVPRINKAITEMKQDGSLQRIIAIYTASSAAETPGLLR